MDIRQLELAPATAGMLHDANVGASAWALAEDALTSLLRAGEIAFDRFAKGEFVAPDALEAYRATHLAGTRRIGVRGRDTAIVYIEGTLVKRESWISQLLGLPTYETIFQDLHTVAQHEKIKSIVLYINSPGGEVNGCSALADAVYALRGKKPVTAFVSGQACSAAYWVASAAERVVLSDMAMVGSIGVSMTVSDTSKRDEQRGITHREFVSSQSPNKRPDVQTDRGRASIQKIVDDLAEVFIKGVAKHRGVSAQTVIDKFGTGGVEVGAKAVAKGMADEVAQFEQVLARLQKGGATQPTKSVAQSAALPPASAAPIIAAAPPKPSAEELARAAAQAEAERKAEIAAIWKKAIDQTNAKLGPHAVRSEV